MNTIPYETPAEPGFEKEAVYLASTYPEMLKQRDWLKARINGDWTYTKEMAIDELTNITVAYDNEHVQSSNISRSTERVAMLLTDEFLAKKQQEYDREREALADQLAYTEWKIEVVERVIKERMNFEQRTIYLKLFIGDSTYEKLRKILRRKKPKKYINRDISAIKADIPRFFCMELDTISQTRVYSDMLLLLSREAKDAENEAM